jgi:hypothetical protein
MVQSLNSLNVTDNEPVAAKDISAAVTATELAYDDGSRQTFTPDGATTYVENGRPTDGEWYVDESGRFCSFWPPTYRACYDLRWIVEQGAIVGLRFVEQGRGSEFTARYQ